MKVTIAFTSSYARTAEYYLRKRYKSKANLEKLCKVAVACEVANEAQKELATIPNSQNMLRSKEDGNSNKSA